MVARLTIVLVEDNDDLRELTADALRNQGHHVVALSCAEELEDKAVGIACDLFLIDLNLPGEDGLSLAKRIRQVQPLVGIFIISARSDLQDKVVGYGQGADLYMTKPTPFVELSAAIDSFARRRQALRIDTSPSQAALSVFQRELNGPAGRVRLTPFEADLLRAFARAPSGQLETWQLLALYGMDTIDSSKSNLEVRVTRLRKKLQQVGAPGQCLEAMRNVGYQLSIPIRLFN
jgi:DNA-binding response OmpR family regulator